MKKFLLSLALAVAGFSVQAATVVETLTIDNFGFTKATTYANCEYTSKDTGIKYTGNMCLSNAANGSCMQFRTGSGKNAGLVVAANEKGYKIVSIAVEPSTTATTTNRWDVYGNTTAYSSFSDLFTETSAGTLVGNGTTKSTVTPTADYAFFGFRANNKSIYIKSITITYDDGGDGTGPASAGLSFASSALEVGVGETVDGPALTKATTAEAVYSSSNDAVATVDAATGKVTGVAAGTATITAKTAATADFKEGEASYTVTVVDYSIPGMTIENPMTVAQALAACTADKQTVYVQGIVTEVTTPWSTQYNNVTYNIVDDGSNDVLVVFRGKWGAGVTPTADKNPEVGARVIVHGDILIYTDRKTGAQTKEVNTGNEIVSYEAPGSFDGVEDIVADDANAPVEYYNLQGVRVANPENGLYIRVQGKKATKVLVR